MIIVKTEKMALYLELHLLRAFLTGNCRQKMEGMTMLCSQISSSQPSSFPPQLLVVYLLYSYIIAFSRFLSVKYKLYLLEVFRDLKISFL